MSWLGFILVALYGGSALAEAPTPLLWKISDADNHIYLLGSFHALKPDDYPLSAAVDLAFADAQSLMFEISPAEATSAELPQKMLQAAIITDGKTLEQMLPAESWLQLERYAKKRNLPMQNLQHMEPWFVSLIIGMTEMHLLGYEASQGLDQTLMARAEKAGTPARGLETADEQIAALDSMSAAEQQQALTEALTEADNFASEMDRLHAQWRAGDDKALYQSMVAQLRDRYPLLYQRIDVARNQAWLPKIRQMLDGEKNRVTLVVVGCLHLLGDEGLIAQLKAKGYTVERL